MDWKWSKSEIYVEICMAQVHRDMQENKLTAGYGHRCECLWMSPWSGRFGLQSALELLCSDDSWGTYEAHLLTSYLFLQEKKNIVQDDDGY